MSNFFGHLFYLFLSSPMLSPEIHGASMYLFLFIPLVDPGFIRYLSTIPIDRRYVISAGLLIAASIPYGSMFFVLKIVSIVITVSYMVYTVRVGTFHLYKYMSLNVLVAAVQCAGYFGFGKEILYPAEVGRFLYGDFALSTGQTGAGALGYLLPFRFSGLSREPGFFSSLLIASFLLLLDHKGAKNRKWHLALHLAGMIVAFSKITIVFFPVFLLAFLFRGFIERIPRAAIIAGTLVFLMAATSYVYDRIGVEFLDISIRHRTIGYAILRELGPKDLLLGVGFRNIESRVSEIPLIAESIWFQEMPGAIAAGSGLSSVIIDHGLLYFLMLVFLVHYLNAGPYELLLFLLLTANENPLTSSSYVLIGMYYLLFNGFHDRHSKYFRVRHASPGHLPPFGKPA